MTTLEERIRRLEDIESIKQLKALYCEICDDGHDPDRITTIFTPDAVWEGSAGTATGHAEIRAMFETFRDIMSFTQHMTMNPRITVEGDVATGTWYFFGPFTYRENDRAKWQAARYEEDYVRVDGEWKIRHLKIVPPGMSVDYETGWGASRYT